jgi:hypothetical protein
VLTKLALKKINVVYRNLWLATCLYLLIFFPYFYISLFSLAIFGVPDTTLSRGLIIVGLFLTVPFSLLFSIFFMWRKFDQKQYSRAYFYFVLPLLVGLICYGLAEII